MSDFWVRLAATTAAAGLLVAAALQPQSATRLATSAAGAAPPPGVLSGPLARDLATAPCPVSRPVFTSGFAAAETVRALTPVGGLAAPGEPPLAPGLRVQARADATLARAPARADLVSLTRRDGSGDTGAWTAELVICEGLAVVVDGLETLSPALQARADDAARPVRLAAGDPLGAARDFAVFVADAKAEPTPQGRLLPHAGAGETVDAGIARCPLDYFPTALRATWAEKFRTGPNARPAAQGCLAAVASTPQTVQGVWYTDSSHNAVADKVSAVAFGRDPADPSRLVFALHGRVRSLAAEAIDAAAPDARARAARDFFTAPIENGRINPAFETVGPGRVFCYEGLRTNIAGPFVDGVLLMRLDRDAAGEERLAVEARPGVDGCVALPDPWSFSGAETTFYR